MNLARRPGHGATAKKMDMEVRDAFAAIGTVIDDESEARIVQAFLLSDGLRDKDQVAEEWFVDGLGGGNARDFLFGDDEDVNGCLRLDVMERQAAVVLVDDPGWNLAGDDAGENGAHDVLID